MSWSHRDVEGLLYGLGQAFDARPSQPHPSAAPRPEYHGPAALPRQVTRRLDVSLAMQTTLDPEAQRIVREHYLQGSARHPYGDRKVIIGRLVAALNSADLES